MHRFFLSHFCESRTLRIVILVAISQYCDIDCDYDLGDGGCGFVEVFQVFCIIRVSLYHLMSMVEFIKLKTK